MITQQILAGNRKELQIHSKALAKMIKIKRDLKGLSECGLLQSVLRWCANGLSNVVAERKTLIAAFYRQDLPSFQFKSIPCCGVHEDAALAENMSFDPEKRNNLHQRILAIFRDLGSLTRQLESGNTPDQRASISKAAWLIEQRILTLPTRELPRTQTEHFDYRAVVARIGALLYVKRVFYGLSSSEASMMRLQVDLLDVHQLWEDHRRAMSYRSSPSLPLWIIVMAGLHSRGHLKDAWMAEPVARAVARAGLETCTDVEYAPPETSSPDRLRCLQAFVSIGVGWQGS